MTYPLEFRKKVLMIKSKQELSFDKIATLFEIGKTTIVNRTKNIVPKTGRNKPATKINMEALKEDVRKYPDSYVYERAQRLGNSKNGVWYALKRLGVTYKKNSKSPKSKVRATYHLSEEN